MNKAKIVFVILHYMAEADTVECVASIREKIDVPEYKIVIVDNCSPNNSGEVLHRRYQNDPDIVYLHNEENLGFAAGNNIGFRYAKAHFDPDYIVLLNNDTLLLDHDSYEKIHGEYEKSGFALLGPMIYTRDGRCNCNPYRSSPLTLEEVRYTKRNVAWSLFFGRMRMERFYKMFVRPKDMSLNHRADNFLDRQENVELHGSFMVFSRRYIDRYDGLNPETFMYMEEDILYYELLKQKLTTVYLPTLHIYHKEDASTNAAFKKGRKKRFFMYENTLRSLSVLEKEMESSEAL